MAGTDTVSLNCSLSNCFMPLTDSGGRIVKTSIFLIVLKILVVLIISNSSFVNPIARRLTRLIEFTGHVLPLRICLKHRGLRINMGFLCVIVLFCIVIAANAVQYVDCGKLTVPALARRIYLAIMIILVLISIFLTGSKICKINSVNVNGCAADAQTCDLVRGTTVTMTLNFTVTGGTLWFCIPCY